MAHQRARLLLVGNGKEGTGPALSLSLVRVAEFSQEETPLVQVRFLASQAPREAHPRVSTLEGKCAETSRCRAYARLNAWANDDVFLRY